MKASNLLRLENPHFSLSIHPDGYAESLLCKDTGAECLDQNLQIPLFSVTQDRLYNNELKLSHPTKQMTFPANRIRMEDGNLIVGFEKIPYEAAISVTIRDRYIAFTLIDFIVKPQGYEGLLMNTPPVASLRLLQLPIAKRPHFGHWLNVAFNETAINVLAACPETLVDTEHTPTGHIMTAEVQRDIRLKGCTAALIASETAALFDGIEAVETDYNLPKGVQSRRDPHINASIYWVRELDHSNLDAHIARAKQGGFRLMLIHYAAFIQEGRAWSYCGNYDFKEAYPNGSTDIAPMLQKIKAAGITPGLHFLHTHIGLLSRYCTPDADRRLHLARRFTLARPLASDDTTVYVDQNPAGSAMAEGCRILRFGKEQICYTGYQDEYPYCFIGCTRGYNDTIPAPHDLGTGGGILDVSEFCATSVYIDQETDLQDEIAAKIADIYNAGFEFAYFDGSEGTNAPFEFHVSNAQYRVYKQFTPPPLFAEGAAKSHFSWHMLSGGNAFDIFPTPVFKEKIAEFPMEQAARMAQDFTRVNFGWWQFYPDTQPDTYEFGTSRAAAWDCPITLKGSLERFDGNPRTDDILEVMRRWEDVRAKNWLTEAQKEALRDPKAEHILLINEVGEYELLPYQKIPAAGGDGRLSAFVFTRKGESYAVYWHTTGQGQLLLPGAKGVSCHDEIGASPITPKLQPQGLVYPLSHRRYLKTSASPEVLANILACAKILD